MRGWWIVALWAVAAPALGAPDANSLTRKDAVGLTPQEIAARSMATLARGYTGKLVLRGEWKTVGDGHRNALGRIWLTQAMTPVAPGICGADILEFDYTHDVPPDYDHLDTWDPPSGAFAVHAGRRYAIVGAVRDPDAGDRDKDLAATDCGKVAWPSETDNFEAEYNGPAVRAMSLLAQAQARANGSWSLYFSAACVGKDGPCKDADALLASVEPGMILAVKDCARDPVGPVPDSDCTLITLAATSRDGRHLTAYPGRIYCPTLLRITRRQRRLKAELQYGSCSPEST